MLNLRGESKERCVVAIDLPTNIHPVNNGGVFVVSSVGGSRRLKLGGKSPSWGRRKSHFQLSLSRAQKEKWLRNEVGLVPGTHENWFTSKLEVRSLAELKAQSGVETELF